MYVISEQAVNTYVILDSAGPYGICSQLFTRICCSGAATQATALELLTALLLPLLTSCDLSGFPCTMFSYCLVLRGSDRSSKVLFDAALGLLLRLVAAQRSDWYQLPVILTFCCQWSLTICKISSVGRLAFSSSIRVTKTYCTCIMLGLAHLHMTQRAAAASSSRNKTRRSVGSDHELSTKASPHTPPPNCSRASACSCAARRKSSGLHCPNNIQAQRCHTTHFLCFARDERCLHYAAGIQMWSCDRAKKVPQRFTTKDLMTLNDSFRI